MTMLPKCWFNHRGFSAWTQNISCVIVYEYAFRPFTFIYYNILMQTYCFLFRFQVPLSKSSLTFLCFFLLKLSISCKFYRLMDSLLGSTLKWLVRFKQWIVPALVLGAVLPSFFKYRQVLHVDIYQYSHTWHPNLSSGKINDIIC